MGEVVEHLPYTVPKSVPKWVLGFPKYLRDEVRVDDPDVTQLHETWLRYETQYWTRYHERGKPRKPRAKRDAPAEGAPYSEGGDAPLDEGGAEGPGEPPAKQAKTRLDTRVRNQWRRRFARLRAIAREHGISALETEVADMERDLEEE